MKSAFTLIELIFAIVIIGISVLSLPMMNQAIGSSQEKNLVQEAILIASGDATKAISGKFDENSIQSSNNEIILPISTPDVRNGLINILSPNNVFPQPTINGLENTELDDVDDYETTGFIDVVQEVGSAQGYKQLYKKNITVTQQTFNDVSDLNAKKVVVTIEDENGNTLVKMHTYTFNTGNATPQIRGLQ